MSCPTSSGDLLRRKCCSGPEAEEENKAEMVQINSIRNGNGNGNITATDTYIKSRIV
jgi:hypothetical protein